jgi:RNA polymerase sigma factor (sigma-70 family)
VLSLDTTTLVREYGGLVSAICNRMIQDRDIAEDASQQVWLEVIKSLPGFRGESKISTWIYKIAQRVVMNVALKERQYTTRFLRGYFRSGERELPQTVNLDKEIWVREMCDQCLTGILHCLDNESRLVYLFKEVVMLDYDEIARIMEKDQTTVRQIISRTRRKLKNFLNDECVLFNPQGACQCRMKKLVQEVNLPLEYEKLKMLSSKISFYRDSQKVLPGKNYWEKNLG